MRFVWVFSNGNVAEYEADPGLGVVTNLHTQFVCKIRRVLVVGALGAGKSTILNVLNSQSKTTHKKIFKSSSQLTGCT